MDMKNIDEMTENEINTMLSAMRRICCIMSNRGHRTPLNYIIIIEKVKRLQTLRPSTTEIINSLEIVIESANRRAETRKEQVKCHRRR